MKEAHDDVPIVDMVYSKIAETSNDITYYIHVEVT